MPKTTKPVKNTWSIQDAKARFSEVVRNAESAGPQRILRHGKPSVVMVRSDEFDRMCRSKSAPSLLDVLLNSPLKGVDFDFSRIRGPEREIEL